MGKDTFYILDGHSQIYRCFHAKMAPLTSPDGEPVKATYTFCRMLIKLLASKKPNFIAMATDGPRSALHRRKLFPGYKGDRDEPDKDIIIQVERIKQIVEALGVPVIASAGYEADDVIATVVDVFNFPGIHTYIISADKDMHQLLHLNCEMYDPQRELLFSHIEVKTKWGVGPDQMVDLQALMGDSSDCVPGVKGIGPVRAKELLLRYGSLDEVLANAEQVSGAAGRALLDARKSGIAELSRKLVRLHNNVPLPNLCVDDFAWTGINWEGVKPIFEELGFKRWLK